MSRQRRKPTFSVRRKFKLKTKICPVEAMLQSFEIKSGYIHRLRGMEEEFYKYADVDVLANELNITTELATSFHRLWTLKRKVGSYSNLQPCCISLNKRLRRSSLVDAVSVLCNHIGYGLELNIRFTVDVTKFTINIALEYTPHR